MEVRLESGEDATLVAFDGTGLTLRGPRAFAPGSPIRFRTAELEPERTFEGRTLGSKRIDDATFEVRLRLINLRRPDREFLSGRFGG